MATRRKINESPVEIGTEEIAPHILTIPTSWGAPTNPSGVAKKDSDGDVVANVIAAITVTLNVIAFTVDGTVLMENQDYRIEIKFDVPGGTLEAWGIWSARL